MHKYRASLLLYLSVVLGTLAHVQGFTCGGKSYDRYVPIGLTTTLTPYYYYPSNDVCSWKLIAPSDMVIKLWFTSFYLEKSSSCNNDYLSVYDGSSVLSAIIGKYCGTTRPPLIVSKGRYLYLRFRSDSSMNYQGFTLKYQAVYPVTSYSSCTLKNSFANNNNINLYSSSGYIYSPGYPSNYPNDMQCTWKISVASGKKIKLYFEYMNVVSSLLCDKDYVRVRDGYSSTSLKKGDYCGTTRRTIYSSGRYLWIRFRSDNLYNSKGFKLRYTSESESSSSSVGVIVGILIGIAVIIAVVVIIVYCNRRNRSRGVVRSTAAPSTVTTTVTTTQQPQAVPLQPPGQAPPLYQNPYPQGYVAPPQGYAVPPQGYAGPPPQGYAGPPPQGYAGPPTQGYAGPPPQGYPGPPPQEYQGPPPVSYPGPPGGPPVVSA